MLLREGGVGIRETSGGDKDLFASGGENMSRQCKKHGGGPLEKPSPRTLPAEVGLCLPVL